MGIIRVITLSNKPDYLREARASVDSQMRPCMHIVGIDDGTRAWGDKYPPSVFFNEEIARAAPDDYICWLSDDDVLLPDYALRLGGLLDARPDLQCVYGVALHVMYSHEAGYHRVMRVLPEQHAYPIFNADYLPLFKLDGGQVMLRRSALDRIERPWCPETVDEHTPHCDGLLLNKLAAAYGIYPAAGLVMMLRTTPKSAHVAFVDGGRAVVDWRRAAQ